ncbi:MAG: G-D-S-L family lipolytic protein [Armatimonadetes bacterium]|nr:G-D-S-L family lipolytic protein [Armatimonadota bacterium]
MPAAALLTLLLLPCSQEARFANEIAAFKKADEESHPAKGQILFIGSSSFTRWSGMAKAFPKYKVLNRAFGGSTLADQIAHVGDVVFPYEPRQIVLYCGENDFAEDEKLEPGVVVDRFKTLFGKIRNRLPNVPFVYVSMKPSPSRWLLAPKFKQANASIREFLTARRRATYVDVWPVMLGADGQPKAEIFVEDKLHMNNEGYKLWTPLIERALRRGESDKDQRWRLSFAGPVAFASQPFWFASS